MKIEVFSDVVCPWCYVGFARLERALARNETRTADVHWLPFQLNPNLPPEGRDRREYLRERFGTDNPFGDAQQRLEMLGRSLGIDFRFDRMERSPNTLKAHRLIAWARHEGERRGDDAHLRIKRALLEAYFTDGADIGAPPVLVGVAERNGLDGAAAMRALEDAAIAAEVEELQALGRSWNVSGVPTFVFERRFAFSGAQPDEVFDRAFAEATVTADPAAPTHR